MSCKQYTTKNSKCKHLNEAERKFIERQLELGTAKKAIARMLGRNISTIRREIKRGTVAQRKRNPYFGISKNPDTPEYFEYKRYYADTGEMRYRKNRLKCGARCKFVRCKKFMRYAEKKIKEEKYSPDAIVGYAKKNNLFKNIPSTQTVYNWIAAGLSTVKSIDLIQKVSRKSRKNKHTDRKRILGRSIDERPELVNLIERFGDWEGDSVVGKEGKSSILTFVERSTGQGILLKTESKTASATIESLKSLRSKDSSFFSQVFKSVTFDNGSEFAVSEELERLGVDVYYAHPYSAWERGRNEHFNGLIRRFIPKGKDLSILEQDDLDRIANYINTMPRRNLNYLSPQDLFSRHVCDIINA